MSKQKFDLDKVLIDLSSKTYPAKWCVRDAVEGLQIFGGIGSGKTSGSGRTIALKYLDSGFGGLVLTAKHDEKALWQEYCREAGRLQDLIIIEPGCGYHFNFLEYEASIKHTDISLTTNIVQVLRTVITAGQDKSGAKGDDSFWETALDMLLTHTLDLCMLAYGTVTVQHIYEIALAAPKRVRSRYSAEAEKKAKEKKPDDPFIKAYQLAQVTVRNKVDKWKAQLSDEEKGHIKDNNEFAKLAADNIAEVRMMLFIKNFFLESFLNVPEKTRSIIDFIVQGFLYNLLRDPVYSLFCRYPSNYTPEDCLKGKIILLALPIKDYQKVGTDAQIMFKYIWQRAMERRRVAENGRPVFLWADEAQHFLHEHDAEYQATARSSRIATVYISQNLPNYFANMGGKDGEYRVKSFLGTLGTKIFHANADIETNEYASKMVGAGYFKKDGYSMSVADKFSSSKSYSWELESIMRPEEFVSLKTGGPDNGLAVEGVIHTQGRQLRKDVNFKKVTFKQDFSLK